MNNLTLFFHTLKTSLLEIFKITKHQDFFKFIILSFFISIVAIWISLLFIIPGIIEAYNQIGVTGFKLTFGGMKTIQGQVLAYDLTSLAYLFKSFGVFIMPLVFFIVTYFMGSLGTKIVFETYDIKNIEIQNNIFVKYSFIHFLQYFGFGVILPFVIIYAVHDVFPFYVSILILISARKIFMGVMYGVLGQVYPVSEIKNGLKTRILSGYVVGSLIITLSASYFVLLPFCIAFLFGLAGYYINKFKVKDETDDVKDVATA